MLPELPTQAETALAFAGHLTVTLVPLFLGGAFLVGLLEEYLPPNRLERALSRHDGGVGNVVAAGAGAVTPFCSCSTVPVLAGLLEAGAPLGLAFSFLLASPLVNELAVALLLGLFGVEVTVAYVAVTFLAAVAGGLVIGAIGLEHHLTVGRTVVADGGERGCAGDSRRGATRAGEPATCADGAGDAQCGDGAGAACAPEPPASATPDAHGARLRRAAASAWTFFRETVPYLALGIALGAVVHGFVPASLVRAVVGPGNPLAVPVAAVAGAPIYVSMSTMLPVAASFADHGVPIGTVLAFVVGSAGVSLPNLVLLKRLFDRALLAVYAVTVVGIGIAVGLLFNAAFA